MKLIAEVCRLRTANDAFRIARSVVTEFRVVIVRLEHNGLVGLGEAAPSAYYGETPDTVVEAVATAARLLGDDPFLLESITSRLARELPDAPSARAAIDMALHDWVGKRLGVPVWRLLGLDPALMPPTSYTISIDEPDVMAERAAAAADRGFKVLKIKVGTDRDRDRIEAIRRRTDLPLRVDANTGWTEDEAVRQTAWLAERGVEFVEQPIPPDDADAMRRLHAAASLPIMADESAVTLADLPELVGCVDSINIKLMKCGGLREAARMITYARAHGMKIMLGCMLETSLAISAAAQLAPLVDYIDLDGHLLIANDPFAGLGLADGRLFLSADPGLGIRPRS